MTRGSLLLPWIFYMFYMLDTWHLASSEVCRSVLHLALRLVPALVHSPPPLLWPAGSLSGAADLPG